MKIKRIFLIFCIFLLTINLSLGASWTFITTDNQSRSAWNETFSGNENKTFWITIPKNVRVVNAYLNLSGFLINTTNIGKYPSMAIDSNYNIHVVYTVNDSVLKYAKKSNNIWTYEILANEEDFGTLTGIAIDSNDFPHIVYSNKTHIKYIYKDNVGWHNEIIDTVESGTYGVKRGPFTSIAVDSNNNPHVAYGWIYLDDHYYYKIKYAEKISGVWSPTLLSSTVVNSADLFKVEIVLNNTDEPRIIEPYNKFFKYNGSGWNSFEYRSNCENLCKNGPSIALDDSDSPHVASYCLYSSSQRPVRYYKWNGTGFERIDIEDSGYCNKINSIYLNRTTPFIAYLKDCSSSGGWFGSLKFAFWNGTTWRGLVNSTKPDVIEANLSYSYPYMVLNTTYQKNRTCSVGSCFPLIVYFDYYNRLKLATWNGSSWNIEIIDIDKSINPFLDVSSDGDTEWSYTGEFSVQEQTSNFSQEIMDYLSTCIPDANGNCDVPFVLHSDTAGKIQISNINITVGSPKWSDNSTDMPSVYNPTKLSIFNITWDDVPGYSIDTVYIEINHTGSFANYTMNLIDPYISESENKGVYSWNATLPAGHFCWRSYAKASDGVWNSTPRWCFTVSKNNSNCDVLFNISSPQTYPTIFKVWTNCDTSFTLYMNGSVIANNSVYNLPAGTYNFTVIREDKQNYTNYYDEELFVINKAKPILVLSNGSHPNDFVSAWEFEEGGGSVTYDSNRTNSNDGTVHGATYTSGIYGYGLKFDGVDDYVEIDNFGGIEDQITIAAWIFSSENQPTDYPPIVEKFVGWNNRLWFNLVNDSKRIHLGYALNGQNWKFAATPIDFNKWVFVVGVINGTEMRIYVDGDLKALRHHDYEFNWTSIDAPIRLGKGTDGQIFNGTIDEVRIYNRALSESEIQQLYNSYLAKTSGLVGYWRFESVSDSNETKDCSGEGNDGTVYGATLTSGKFGNALEFDGVDDYIDVPSSESLTIPNRTELTVTAWVKRNELGGIGVYHTIASLGGWGRDGWTFRIESDNKLMFIAHFTDGTYTPEIEGGYIDTNWHFVSAVYDGRVHLYVDGEEVATSEYFGKTISGRDFSLRIGRLDIGINSFNGTIDEVMIFDRALSEREIQLLYRTKVVYPTQTTFNLTETQQGDADGSYMVRLTPTQSLDDYVLYLPFDEGHGSEANDNSVFGNDGTVYGASWVDGKFGKALSFDGVDDYVKVPDSESLDITDEITVLMWVKQSTTPTSNAYIIDKHDAQATDWGIYVDADSKIIFQSYGTSDNYVTTGYSLPNGEWKHIVFTWDGNIIKLFVDGEEKYSQELTGSFTTSTNPIEIGRKIGNNDYCWNGIIDEVRIYDRALSEEEIRALYEARAKDIGETETLGAGTYYYSFFSPETRNYTSQSFILPLEVEKNSSPCSVHFNASSPQTYPTAFRVWSDCDTSFTLYRNGSEIANNSIQTLAAGTYNFTVIRDDDQNYTNYYDEEMFVIEKGVPSLSISCSDATYPDNATCSASESNVGDGDLIYNFYVNDVLKASGSDINYSERLAAGSYTAIYNTSGGQNWTSAQVAASFTVSKGTPSLSLSCTNATYPDNLTCSASESNIGDGDLVYNLYVNGTLKASGSSISYNERLAASIYTIVYNTSGGQNWSSAGISVAGEIRKHPAKLFAYLNSTYYPSKWVNNNTCWNVSAMANETSIPIKITSNYPAWQTINGTGFLNRSVTINGSDGATFWFNVTLNDPQNYTASDNVTYVKIDASAPSLFNLTDKYHGSVNYVSLEQEHQFNVSACDLLSGIDPSLAKLEFSGVNYTANYRQINSTCYEFYATLTGLQPGTYNYTWYVADSVDPNWATVSGTYNVYSPPGAAGGGGGGGAGVVTETKNDTFDLYPEQLTIIIYPKYYRTFEIKACNNLDEFVTLRHELFNNPDWVKLKRIKVENTEIVMQDQYLVDPKLCLTYEFEIQTPQDVLETYEFSFKVTDINNNFARTSRITLSYVGPLSALKKLLDLVIAMLSWQLIISPVPQNIVNTTYVKGSVYLPIPIGIVIFISVSTATYYYSLKYFKKSRYAKGNSAYVYATLLAVSLAFATLYVLYSMFAL